MARPRKPWSITASRGAMWYYRLEGWATYQSTGILVERNSKGGPTARSRREAEEYASRRWHSSAMVDARGETIGEELRDAYVWERCEYIAEILTDSAGEGYAENTARWNRSRIQRFVLDDEIADEPVDALPAVWQRWKRRMVERGQNPPEGQPAFGARTINLTLDHVRSYFQWRVERGEMKWNPLASVGAIREEPAERGIFTLEELRSMFANPQWWGYPGREKLQEQRGALAFAAPTLIASTLCRPFEVFGIRWGDVDLSSREMRIPGVKRVRGNQAGRGRIVPLGEAAAEALGALERSVPDELVFGGRTREFYDKRFAAMMKNSGLPQNDPDGRPRKPYCLKDTMYTLLIDGGADPVTVAELAGHSRRTIGARSLTATQEHYKRASLERMRTLVPMIDRLLGWGERENVVQFPRHTASGTD